MWFGSIQNSSHNSWVTGGTLDHWNLIKSLGKETLMNPGGGYLGVVPNNIQESGEASAKADIVDN